MSFRARSSAVEHCVDIAVVTGSIPVAPTIFNIRRRRRALGRFRLRRVGRIKKLGDKMKVRNSLRSLKARHRDCQLVRRKGRIVVINKTQKKFKARQG